MPQFDLGNFKLLKKKKNFLPLKIVFFWDLETIFWKILENEKFFLIFFLRIVKVSLCHLCVLQFEV